MIVNYKYKTILFLEINFCLLYIKKYFIIIQYYNIKLLYRKQIIKYNYFSIYIEIKLLNEKVKITYIYIYIYMITLFLLNNDTLLD